LPTGSNLQANGGAFPTPAPGSYLYAFRGNAPGIEPQTAKTLSLGVDIDPPFIPGLKLGVTYWKIDLKGVIGLAPFQTPQVVYQNYPYLVTVLTQPNTTANLAALSALAAGAQLFPFGAPCHTNPAPCSIYAILDARKNNLGDFKVSGLDFNLAYNHETSFGSIQLAGNATYILTQQARANSNIPYRDAMDNAPSRLKLRLSAGASVGNLFGQITWNHRSGYDLSVPVGFVPQTRVDSFNAFNLFFKYDVNGEKLLKDLSFTLNVDNVFDQAPPEYRAVTVVAGASGYTNGSTLGRLVQFGVSKKF
jgi:iron complex outermembrane receptor protein